MVASKLGGRAGLSEEPMFFAVAAVRGSFFLWKGGIGKWIVFEILVVGGTVRLQSHLLWLYVSHAFGFWYVQLPISKVSDAPFAMMKKDQQPR